MSAPSAAPSRARSSDGLGLTLRLGMGRANLELRQFYRSPELVFFTFLLPVLFVVIFSTVFSDEIEGPAGARVPFPQYFLAGMIAAGVMSTTFTSLATTISIERSDGLLKRVAGTPLPKASYFMGKIVLAAVTSAIQAAIIMAIGATLYGVSLPSDPGLWAVFAWVFVLGVASCSLLGIAYTRLIPEGSMANAIVQPPYLTLQFISGVFFPYDQIPPWLKFVASIFPLKWMVQGMRHVFLPDWVAVNDYGGEWHLEQVAGMLIGWTIAGFVLSLLFFRWQGKGEK